MKACLETIAAAALQLSRLLRGEPLAPIRAGPPGSRCPGPCRDLHSLLEMLPEVWSEKTRLLTASPGRVPCPPYQSHYDRGPFIASPRVLSGLRRAAMLLGVEAQSLAPAVLEHASTVLWLLALASLGALEGDPESWEALHLLRSGHTEWLRGLAACIEAEAAAGESRVIAGGLRMLRECLSSII